MATSGLVIDRFAEMLGMLPSSVDRMLRPLRDAGMAPMGAAGRKSQRGHFEPYHLANLMLACAGNQPSDAADAVRALRPLVFHKSTGTNAGFSAPLPSCDLGSAIERIIEGTEGIGPADGVDLAATPQRGWTVWICFDPLSAWIGFDGMHRRIDYYRPNQSSPASGKDAPRNMQKITTLFGAVMLTARELWQDTLAQRGAIRTAANIINPSLPGALPGAGPEDETPTALPGDVGVLRVQPAETDQDRSSQNDPTRQGATPQPTVTAPGRSHRTPRSRKT